MFFKRLSAASDPASASVRPSKLYQQRRQPYNDQLPFLSRSRFSALPQFRPLNDTEQENLTLFIAILYVIDLFGVLPFFTLPALLVQLGIFGVLLVVFVVILQIYTSFLLSQCWIMAEALDPNITQKSRYPYAAIADLAYGPRVSFLVRGLLDLSIFATAILNIVVAAQNLELVDERIGGGRSRTLSFCYWVIVVGVFCCPLMWLRSPKHMRGLAILSVCVVIVVVILLWLCLFAAAPIAAPFEGVRLGLPPLLTMLNGYSILAFQFDIHPVLLTLQIDMQQKSQVYWAAFSGIIITCTVAIFGSIIAAYKFGSMIAENLLETLPRSVALFCLLILIALQLCFSTVVASSAMLLQLENFFKVPEAFSFKRLAIRSTVVALEVIIAEFVPNFDVLVGIVGGTITGPLVFILPPLLYRRIRRMQRSHHRVAIEAAYGSMQLDLNYEPSSLEMKLLESPDTLKKVSPRSLWLRFRRFCHHLQCDLSMTLFVLSFGILAAFFATFLNLYEINDLFRNNSPCFNNLTRPLQWN